MERLASYGKLVSMRVGGGNTVGALWWYWGWCRWSLGITCGLIAWFIDQLTGGLDGLVGIGVDAFCRAGDPVGALGGS